MTARGERERHVLGLARVRGSEAALALAGRFFAGLSALPLEGNPGTTFRDVPTGRAPRAERAGRRLLERVQ